jgi:dipeptidyl aminopeptidase/acylaminoacyl peptidase
MRVSRTILAGLFLLAPFAFADEADPRRPAAMETQEVPVVPVEIFERLRPYQAARSAAFGGWDPLGKGVLIHTRFGDSSQLHRVYEPGGRREQITFYDEPVRGVSVPEAKDGAILFAMSRGGDENDQIYCLQQQTGGTLMLTDGRSRNRLDAFRDDGERVIIASNLRNNRDTDLYLADPRRPDSMEMVFEVNGEFWSAADWSHDGQTLLLTRYVSINEGFLALLDLQTRQRVDLPLPVVGEKAAVGPAKFAPDDRSIYVATDSGAEFRRLAKLDLETKKYTFLTQDIPWDVDELEVDRVTGTVTYTVNHDGASRLYRLEGDRPEPLETPLGVISSLEFSPDGGSLGFTLSRPDAPAEVYSLQLDNGELTRWTYSEVGGLNPGSFVQPARIAYPTFDSREIPAYVFEPRGASREKPAPVLIEIHGGPEGQYRPLFNPLTQFYVNELGLAVIHPNVRGSAGYGKTYLTLDNAEKREDSVRDIGALLDWIEQQPELDSSRVAVSGGSYGGYMVLASLTHYSDRIKAGIDLVGIANFITFLERTAPYRQDLRRAEYGDERDPQMRAVFERINPSANAHKIRSALLVAHGRNDPRVPFFEAEQIAARVREQGQPVWTLYADNEGHGFAKKANSDYLRAVAAYFLKKQLKLPASSSVKL